jgi:RNA polymerase sigma-70 factor, ECF subfamily
MKSLRFKILVHTHQKWIYTYALYFLGNRADAEDVCQEVLLRIWRHLEEIKWDTGRPWIIKTTRNLCLDLIRKRKHAAAFSNDDETALHQPTHNPQHDPLEMAHSRVLQKHISDALMTLPEIQRSAVILRDIQDMSYQQISTALEIPLNTAKVYILRGRQALRQILANQLRGELQNV